MEIWFRIKEKILINFLEFWRKRHQGHRPSLKMRWSRSWGSRQIHWVRYTLICMQLKLLTFSWFVVFESCNVPFHCKKKNAFLFKHSYFNPTRGSLWNASQMAGGAFNACPFKNQFKSHFNPNFSHNLNWGTKITLEKFRKLGF